MERGEEKAVLLLRRCYTKTRQWKSVEPRASKKKMTIFSFGCEESTIKRGGVYRENRGEWRGKKVADFDRAATDGSAAAATRGVKLRFAEPKPG